MGIAISEVEAVWEDLKEGKRLNDNSASWFHEDRGRIGERGVDPYSDVERVFRMTMTQMLSPGEAGLARPRRDLSRTGVACG